MATASVPPCSITGIPRKQFTLYLSCLFVCICMFVYFFLPYMVNKDEYIFVKFSSTRPTCATSSRGCNEDAVRKLLPWNLSTSVTMKLAGHCAVPVTPTRPQRASAGHQRRQLAVYRPFPASPTKLSSLHTVGRELEST